MNSVTYMIMDSDQNLIVGYSSGEVFIRTHHTYAWEDITPPKYKREPVAASTPLTVLELDEPVINLLCGEGINTIAKLLDHTAADLLRIRYIGRSKLLFIRIALDKRGLRLKYDDECTGPVTDWSVRNVYFKNGMPTFG